MLNVGVLAPGAADYYLGEVADSTVDYYAGRGEAAGRWTGRLAPDLGLEGPVTPEAFRAVLAGRHPGTGVHLGRPRPTPVRCHHRPGTATLFDGDRLDITQAAVRLRLSARQTRRLLQAGEQAVRLGLPAVDVLVGAKARLSGKAGPEAWTVPAVEVDRYLSHRKRVAVRPGFDLTLRPPKSVSIVWALADPVVRREVREAHTAAVDATVAWLEDHAIYARHGGGDRARIATGGLVAAAFDHRTSRAGDPLLHTHVVCANLTHTVADRWQALDSRTLFRNTRPAGSLYQAHLRHELSRRLGVTWTPVINGCAEIDGIHRDVIEVFSKRRHEIDDLLAEAGYTTPKAAQTATLASRSGKDQLPEFATLRDRWRQEARTAGLTPAALRAVTPGPRTVEPWTDSDTDRLLDHLAGPRGLTARDSTFTRADVVQAIAEIAADRLPADTIDQLATRFVTNHETVVALTPAVARHADLWTSTTSRERSVDLVQFTTAELVRLEADLLDWADQPSPAPVAAHVATDGLVAEQARMAAAIATRPSMITVVSGGPGSGKTHAAALAVTALADAGIPVAGAALSAAAAGELEASCHFADHTGRPASTLARLHLDLTHYGVASGTTVILDEASMIATRDLHPIAAAVARAGGRLVLVGDPDQHGAIHTGGLYTHLARTRADVVELHGNRRQADAGDRQAIRDLRDGHPDLALDHHQQSGNVVTCDAEADTLRRLVTDWHHATVAHGNTDPMIVGRHQTRRQLNTAARTLRSESGHLAGPTLEAADREYQAGDWVVARRNNSRLAGPGGSVTNSSRGVITGVDTEARTVTVDFHRQGRVTVPGHYLDAGHLDHGYAQTSHTLQGATVTNGWYHPDDRATFEEAYVALTRARSTTRLYLTQGLPDPDQADTAHPGQTASTGPVGADTLARQLTERTARTPAHHRDPGLADRRPSRHEPTDHLAVELERWRSSEERQPRSAGKAAGLHRMHEQLVTRARLAGTGSAPESKAISEIERRLADIEAVDGATPPPPDRAADVPTAHVVDTRRLAFTRQSGCQGREVSR